MRASARYFIRLQLNRGVGSPELFPGAGCHDRVCHLYHVAAGKHPERVTDIVVTRAKLASLCRDPKSQYIRITTDGTQESTRNIELVRIARN
jgi:hypothetical protein